MREPLHHYMQVGIVHFMLWPECLKGEGPVLETLQTIIEDDFFDVVEMAPIKDPAVRAEAVRRARAAKLAVGLAAQPLVLINRLNLNSLDDAERRAAVGTLLGVVEEGAQMGVGRVALLSGRDPGPAPRGPAVEALVDSLRTLARAAGEQGMELALEVFDHDVDKCALVGPAHIALHVARAVRRDCPNFGLMVDLSHIPLIRETAREALVPVQDYLMHVHIGNAAFRDREHPAWGDNHPRFGVDGGENDVPQLVDFLRTLFQVGYLQEGRPDRPVVSFEVKPMPGEDPRVVLANAKRTLREAWRLV